MAYKKNYKRQSTSKKRYSASERKSYRNGFFAGLFASKKSSKNLKRKQSIKKMSLMEAHKLHRELNLGALAFGGKIYDTNFKSGPKEITKEELRELHKEYNFDGTATDIQVADRYVRHMRKKFGSFEKNTGRWLGLLGDK